MIRILLAEDHDDNRDMLLRRLARAGFEARGVADGFQALAETIAWQPDIVLMDVSMPVMSGLDATREIRAAGLSTRIIALTAHAMTESREACLSAGCDAFETKPIDFTSLLNEIKRQTEQLSSEPAQ